MVVHHQKFELGGKCVIEKMVVKTPFRFTAKFSDEGCFIYFKKGHAVIHSAAEQFNVNGDESVLLTCGNYVADLLRSDTSEQHEVLVIHLYPDILRKVYQQEVPEFLKADQKGFIRKVVTDEVIQKFIESLYFYFENPGLVDDELLQLKMKELILLLSKSDRADSILGLFSYLFTPREVTVREVVNNHLYSALSLQDLASLANMSLSTFTRTFQSMYHETPANYIKSQRLERAKELLLVSSKSISEIAYECCFNDLAHFSRSFKEKFHQSPSDFRTSPRQQD